jgi:hypothetical protein
MLNESGKIPEELASIVAECREKIPTSPRASRESDERV